MDELMNPGTRRMFAIRTAAVFVADCITIILSYFLALWIRFDFSVARIPARYIGVTARFLPVALIVTILL